jgi:pimeloyl-ACP methyl ester carboxylesterase
MPTDPDSQTLAAYRAAPVERVDAGDAVVALRRFGSGPALLFVHGFPLHGFTWRTLVPTLAREFTCLVPDLAGLGDTEWTPATTFDFPDHARRLKAMLDRLGVDRYAAIAQDTGATVARCLALLDGRRMEKLVMLNTEIPGHRPPWIREYQMLLKLPGTTSAFRLMLGWRWYLRSPMGFGGCFDDLGLIDGEFHEAFVAPLLASPRRLEGLTRYLGGATWPVVDAFERRHADIQAAMLLVWGEDDPTFPVARAREMTRQIRDCRGFVTVPRAKLLVHEERPRQVLDAVTPFLRDAAAQPLNVRAGHQG